MSICISQMIYNFIIKKIIYFELQTFQTNESSWCHSLAKVIVTVMSELTSLATFH